MECDDRLWQFEPLIYSSVLHSLSMAQLISTIRLTSKHLLRVCHMYCEWGLELIRNQFQLSKEPGARSSLDLENQIQLSKEPGAFLQRDHNKLLGYYRNTIIVSQIILVVVSPKNYLFEIRVWEHFCKEGSSNGLSYRLHVWSLSPMIVNTRIDAGLCIKLKCNSKGSDYRLNISKSTCISLVVSPLCFSRHEFLQLLKRKSVLKKISPKQKWTQCKSFEKSVSHQIIHSLLQIQKLG